MKKIIAFLLMLGVASSLLGCTRGKLPEDSMLIAEAQLLLQKSLVFNRLLFEEGIPVKENGYTEGNYIEADAEALAALGFQKLSDIKAQMGQVFSHAATGDFIRYTVDKRADGTVLIKPAYCYDYYQVNEENPDDKVFMYLMVSKEGVHQKTDPFTYDFSTISVVQEKKQPTSATLKIMATIRDAETGASQTREVTFRLVLEEEGWRLDNLTCLSYQEKQEQPEGLDEILKKD